jgi:hypothetical protein
MSVKCSIHEDEKFISLQNVKSENLSRGGQLGGLHESERIIKKRVLRETRVWRLYEYTGFI